MLRTEAVRSNELLVRSAVSTAKRGAPKHKSAVKDERRERERTTVVLL